MNTDKRIMIRIILPVSGYSHDVVLPTSLRIGDVIPTLVAMLQKLHDENLLLSDEPMLCRSVTGDALANMEATLEACYVRDADTLYLV